MSHDLIQHFLQQGIVQRQLANVTGLSRVSLTRTSAATAAIDHNAFIFVGFIKYNSNFFPLILAQPIINPKSCIKVNCAIKICKKSYSSSKMALH